MPEAQVTTEELLADAIFERMDTRDYNGVYLNADDAAAGLLDSPLGRRIEALESLAEAVRAYVDPDNQFTYSRWRTVERALAELEALT